MRLRRSCIHMNARDLSDYLDFSRNTLERRDTYVGVGGKSLQVPPAQLRAIPIRGAAAYIGGRVFTLAMPTFIGH